VRALFERFMAFARACGPVTVIAQKTRIALQARTRFAAVTPQKRSLRGHLVLPSRQESPCFKQVETLSPRKHLHRFRLDSEEQLGEEFSRWVTRAYRAGLRKQKRRAAANSQ
jgi:hypothetical protein